MAHRRRQGSVTYYSRKSSDTSCFLWSGITQFSETYTILVASITTIFSSSTIMDHDIIHQLPEAIGLTKELSVGEYITQHCTLPKKMKTAQYPETNSDATIVKFFAEGLSAYSCFNISLPSGSKMTTSQVPSPKSNVVSRPLKLFIKSPQRTNNTPPTKASHRTSDAAKATEDAVEVIEEDTGAATTPIFSTRTTYLPHCTKRLPPRTTHLPVISRQAFLTPDWQPYHTLLPTQHTSNDCRLPTPPRSSRHAPAPNVVRLVGLLLAVLCRPTRSLKPSNNHC